MRYQQFASHAYRGTIFQDGVAAGEGFVCVHGLKKTLYLCGASFLNHARNSHCTVITDLDTSKWSK
jgi:hypothetical protein